MAREIEIPGYAMTVEDDGAMTISKFVRGTGYVRLARGYLSDSGKIVASCPQLCDEVYDALEAAWAAED